MTPADDRAGYIAGLRKLADVLEASPGIELPTDGTRLHMCWGLWGDDARERMAAIARAVPCTWVKDARGDDYFDLNGTLCGGLKLKITAYRDQVCTRRVTGTETREVEEEVTPAVTRKVMREVEVAEWICDPVLGPAAHDRAGAGR